MLRWVYVTTCRGGKFGSRRWTAAPAPTSLCYYCHYYYRSSTIIYYHYYCYS